MDVQNEGEANYKYPNNVVEMEDASLQADGESITHNSNDTDTFNTEAQEEACGHDIQLTRKDILQIGHININGIPECKNDVKNSRLHQAIDEHDFQIVGIIEINQCWHLLEEDNRWRSCTKGWWEASKASIAYNVKDGELSSSFQPGGIMLLSLNTCAHQVL